MKKSMFYTDKQGRTRYMGGSEQKQSTAQVKAVEVAPTRQKAGFFFKDEEGRTRFAGGPGSGAGGSSATTAMPTLYNKAFTRKTLPEVELSDKDDIDAIYESLNNVAKIVNVQNIGMGDMLLLPTKENVLGGPMAICAKGAYGETKGKRVLTISTGKMDESIKRNGLSSALKWNGLPEDATRRDLISHIAAHEIGHRFMRTTPGLEERWERISNTKWISEYASYYLSHTENFADAFALFTQGYDLPPQIESFMLEVTK